MINKFIEKHGNIYDYSLVDLKKLKVKIICRKHGIFEQNKYSHSYGMGCWECSVEQRANLCRSNTKEFIKKSKLRHGDIYDYSLVDYKNNKTKIIIICKEHGDFKQLPSSHLNGNGCPKCGIESQIIKQKDTTSSFIKKALLKHGDLYNYSKVYYKDHKTKLTIICKEHGEFKQLANNHLSGQGCPKCSGKFRSKKEFIDLCNIKHLNKYDYSLVNYEKVDDYINIICKEHGEFIQKSSNHLSGQGCPKCSGVEKSNIGEFINKSKKVHLNKYDYSKSIYTNANHPLVIICKNHGEFNQTPYKHLSGQGCPICKLSKGEKKIMNFLIKNNIKYEHQKKFDDCLNIRKLPFDFYLPDYNILIEYDGIQHFEPVDQFGGEEAFKNLKIRDKIKDEYCYEKNIRILRIPYNICDIDYLIKESLKI